MKKIYNLVSRHIHTELIMLHILAFVIGFLFYFGVSNLVGYCIEQYADRNSLMEKYQKKEAQSLQSFVKSKNLSIYALREINNWIKKENGVCLKIYYNSNLVYDSISGHVADEEVLHDIKDEGDLQNDLNEYYEIAFCDADTMALIYSFPIDNMKNLADKIILFVAGVLFFAFETIFVNKKVRYLLKIREQLKVLCDGNFGQSFRPQGNDEISYIAKDIERLRNVILCTMENEKKAYLANNELITSLSHDIRTPLTALIGYLEQMKEESNPEKRREYLQLATNKSYRLKKLTDELFEYFYINKVRDTVILSKVNGTELVMQMVEDTLIDLETSGYKVERNIQNVECMLCVNVDMIKRVFDNIFSNISKYADESYPIKVNYYLQDGYLVVSFFNQKIKPQSPKRRGTQLGLINCRRIVELHQGKLKIKDTDNTFYIAVSLKCT